MYSKITGVFNKQEKSYSKNDGDERTVAPNKYEGLAGMSYHTKTALVATSVSSAPGS